jgi:hypothetical protein
LNLAGNEGERIEECRLRHSKEEEKSFLNLKPQAERSSSEALLQQFTGERG